MNLWAETQFNPQQFPWLFVFLRSHSCIWSKFWFDLSGLALYPFPVIYMDHAEFPLVGHLLSVLLGSLNTIWECDGRGERGTHLVSVASAHVCVPSSHQTSLTKPKFRGKIIKDPKMVTLEH